MDNITKIKKSLKRRHIELKDEALKINKKSNLYKICMLFMTVYALFVGFAIYAKNDVNGIYLNSVLKTNFNFKEFNETINDFLDLRIIKDKNNGDMVVSGSTNYIDLGNDYYMSDGNLAISLDDGVVSYVNGKDDSYMVIIEYDNGVIDTYYDLVEVNVFSNDRVYSNDIIGSYNEKVRIIFIKNDMKVSYEDAISN